MGLLDDAIREHLDLKRRRGADPAEIERAERDALGPVRRGPEGSGEVDLDYAPAGDEELGYDHEEPGFHGDASAHDEQDLAYDDHEPVSPPEFEPSFGQETQAWHPDEPIEAPEPAGHATPEPYAAPPPAQPPVSEPLSSEPPLPLDGETAEYDLEDGRHVEGEDVLEETPEFLQDTPDHDRLWFEQRPPKDFDFDE